MGLARRTGATVCLTRGTHAALHTRSSEACNGVTLRLIDSHDAFELGCVEIRPFPVPHDAREPVQYVIAYGELRLGVLTDLGMLTPHVERSLEACDGLVLEFNHDTDMLAQSVYPPWLKARIGGQLGHLSNQQSAEILQSLDRSRLKRVIAAHLSQKNNSPEKVWSVIDEVRRDSELEVVIADQAAGFAWLDCGAEWAP